MTYNEYLDIINIRRLEKRDEKVLSTSLLYLGYDHFALIFLLKCSESPGHPGLSGELIGQYE